jgi:hypothetical protein
MSAWMQRATKEAETVYKEFLDEVVKKHVIDNRCSSQDEFGRELSEKEKKLIQQGKMHDPRVVRLMSISGKGGWHKDVEKQKRYAKNYNVTLLDHLLSVTRGSLMLASLDWLSRNPDMDAEFLRRKLYVMAVVAFMHDIDKDLRIPRITDVSTVTDADVEQRLKLYGIHEFLDGVNVKIEADKLLYLIDKVEALQANRRLPKELPPRFMDGSLPLYVRFADKLDGIWLSDGIEGVLERLKTDRSCIRSEFLDEAHVIDLFDPHHPFLIDELQRRLSAFSRRKIGVPPLIEIHHDGRLLMLLLGTEQEVKTIKELAIQNLCQSLPFSLDLFVSPRGEPYLLNEKPNHERLWEFVSNLKQEKLQSLFRVKSVYKELIKLPLYDLLDDFDLSPVFPERISASQKTLTLYASQVDMSEKAKYRLKKVAHAVLLLNLLLKTKAKDKNEIPNYAEREQAFLACIPESRPEWIGEEITDGHSRRILTALWAITIAIENQEVDEAIWGKENGLLKQWLEGTEDGKVGFRQFMTAEGDSVIKGVEEYFRQLFAAERIEVEDEDAEGRCLFTDQPVDIKDRIQDKMGLGKLGIKASAFSGRDNRPEALDLDHGETNISPISMAEYKLRLQVHEQTSKGKIEAATLIYSPATVGLFGGLAMDIDQDMSVMSLQALSSFDVRSSNIIGMEHYMGRYRITRLEYVPGKMADQVNKLHRLLKAGLRIGRPIHVFRGLPTANRAFFYYDAMPRLIAELVSNGKNELRLEQISPAIKRLELAKLLLDTWGYGYNALQLYANPKTRFKGICFAWCGLYEKSRLIVSRLELEYESYFDGGELKMNSVTREDGVMVKLGKLAATIQAFPKKGFQASKSEQTMVFDVCLEVLGEAFKLPQPQIDKSSLVNGVAERLETMLARRDLVAAGKHRSGSFQEACIDVATLFIEDFWIGVMNKRFPSQDNLRFLKSVYRMAFMRRANE